MNKRKYNLVGTKNCREKERCICIIANVSHISIVEAKRCFDNEEIFADPSEPNYCQMIKFLDSCGIEVFDYERVQLPKREKISNGQLSYT